MRVFKKLMALGLFACSMSNAFAADIEVTSAEIRRAEVDVLGGEEYQVYMRKMNAIQKVLTASKTDASEFIKEMNKEQGGSYENIPASPDKETKVYTFTSYESFMASDLPDSTKNMVLSDYGLSVDSDFAAAPPLDGSIVVDEYLSVVAGERTADQFSTDPQTALVSLNGLFEETGMEEMIAPEPNKNYETALVTPDVGYGFISKAYASGFLDLDKSRVKTDSESKTFDAHTILDQLNTKNDYAELKLDGDLGILGELYLGVTYKERTWSGVPYKWYFEHVSLRAKVKATQAKPATLIGTVHYEEAGDLISAIQLLDFGYDMTGMIGPVPYKIEFDLASSLGLKYFFNLEGEISAKLTAGGEYYGQFMCTKDDCDTVAENNTLEFNADTPRGHVSVEAGLYPWVTADARIGLEAMFLDIADAKVHAGAAAKIGAWGYIGNDCRIDGSTSPALDTAWMVYANVLYWGYSETKVDITGDKDRKPLKLGGKVGEDHWREFTPQEKAMFGIDGDTYNATRLEYITGDTDWLNPAIEFPESVYVGEPIEGQLKFRPCLPMSIMENTVNAIVDYGDMRDSFQLSEDKALKKTYPYVEAREWTLRSWADRIGAVKLESSGYQVPLLVTEPNFGLGGGLNKSTIPQNSVVLH